MPDNETINTDLQKLHKTLIAQVDQLSKQVSKAPDTATVRALLNEINEVNHRVTQVGALLFAKQTKRLTTAVGKIIDTEAETRTAIKNIEDVAGFLKAMSGFLALVDKAIDTAKIVMI